MRIVKNVMALKRNLDEAKKAFESVRSFHPSLWASVTCYLYLNHISSLKLTGDKQLSDIVSGAGSEGDIARTEIKVVNVKPGNCPMFPISNNVFLPIVSKRYLFRVSEPPLH